MRKHQESLGRYEALLIRSKNNAPVFFIDIFRYSKIAALFLLPHIDSLILFAFASFAPCAVKFRYNAKNSVVSFKNSSSWS